jgi:LmbE family N-acetylglucosaminyl deacetylase
MHAEDGINMTDTSEVSRPKRVLAVGAHPDDIEILCSGTLARYSQMGVKVSIAIATDGTAGHMLIPPTELATIRREEAVRAASLINAQVHPLNYADELLFDDHETRLGFVDVIRETKPDLILTHDPEDYHPDHRATSRLVFNASFVAGLPNVKTKYPAHALTPPLVYFDTLTGTNFVPTEYVDVTQTYALKREMLQCHTSQLKWLKEHDSIDVLEFIDTMGRFRGLQCGVKYAEAFRIEPAWPRLRAYRLLP